MSQHDDNTPPPDQADVDATFAALTASLPGEDDLWQRGQLDEEVLAAMERCSVGRLPGTLPPAALPPAVITGCLQLDHLDPPSRNRRFKAIERHARSFADVIRVVRFDTPMPLDAYDLARPLGGGVRTLVFLDAADPGGWLAARVEGPFGDLAIVGRSREDPWASTALAAAEALRFQLPPQV